MGAITGFASRTGSAFGSFLHGVAITLIGFDATLEVQSNMTLIGIRGCTYLLPVASAVVQFLLWKAYNLEAKLPEVHKTLESRRARTGEEVQE